VKDTKAFLKKSLVLTDGGIPEEITNLLFCCWWFIPTIWT